MSKNDFVILPDGRKTSDLPSCDLKHELSKLGLDKTGTKLELLTNLNAALDITSDSVENNNKEASIDSSNIIAQRKPFQVKSTFGVDLDDCDGIIEYQLEMNQSMDTIELGAPMDASLNPVEEQKDEDPNMSQVTSKEREEPDCNLESNVSCFTLHDISVSSHEEKSSEYSDKIEANEEIIEEVIEEVLTPKRTVIDTDANEMVNIDMAGNLEMYEGDIADEEINNKDSLNITNNDSETIRITIMTETRKDRHKISIDDVQAHSVSITSRLGKRKVIDEDDDELSPRKIKRNSENVLKVLGHANEEPLRVKSPHKSKYTVSDVLRVDNLVRPFTMTQLQDLLSQKGKVLDLWLNKIKSFAYVKYENESAAISARETLDGCKWPLINPKLLVADFSSYKEMEWMKEKGDSGINPPTHLRQLDTAKLSNLNDKLQLWNTERPINSERRKNQDNKHGLDSNRENNEERKREENKRGIVKDVQEGEFRDVKDWDYKERKREVEGDGFREVKNDEHRRDKRDVQRHIDREVQKAVSGDVKEDRRRDEHGDGTRVVRRSAHREEQKEGLRPVSRYEHGDGKRVVRRSAHRDEQKEGLRPVTKDEHRERRRNDQKEVKREEWRDFIHEKSKEKTAPATKRLEDLFRKTVTKPPVYWQPVNREQEVVATNNNNYCSRMHLL